MDTKFGGYDRRFTETSQVLINDGKKVEDPKIVGGGTGVINWKTVEFWIGGANGTDVYKDRTNWRKINLGGIDFSQKPVSDKVVLIPEQTEFKVVSEVKYKDESEDVGGGAGGILDAIKSGVEIFTGAVARPEWSARSFEDLGPFGLDGEYTFKFAYGKFGLFNAFEEVVKPILALTLFFGVEAIVEDKNGNSSSAFLNSAASLTIVTPILDPPQHGFTTHGSVSGSFVTSSSRFSFFMAMPLGAGIPALANSCFAIPLFMAIALLK